MYIGCVALWIQGLLIIVGTGGFVIAVKMDVIPFSKCIVVIYGATMAVGANACVDFATDARVGVEPFLADVAEVSTLGIVAVVAAKRLLSRRVVESCFDCAVG